MKRTWSTMSGRNMQRGVNAKRARRTGIVIPASAGPLVRLGGRLPMNRTRGSLTELKNIDVNPINFPAFGATTGQLTLLNGCIQGSGATNRIGRRITMRSIQLRGRIQVAATTTGASPVRLIIFYDRQANGTAPTATDLLNADTISDFNNLSNNRRFVIVAEQIRSCIGTAGPQSIYFNMYKRIKLITEFNTGNAGTVGDIQTGSLYCLAYASAGIQVASLACNVQTRVRFTDN